MQFVSLGESAIQTVAERFNNQSPEERKKYFTCLACGEEQARAVKHCIVPMHKSNYVVVSDRNLLTGVNQKGGLVK
jgi:hypothetical protein